MDRYDAVTAVVSNDNDTVLRWKGVAPDRILCSFGFVTPEPPDVAFLRSKHAAERLACLGELGPRSPRSRGRRRLWGAFECVH